MAAVAFWLSIPASVFMVLDHWPRADQLADIRAMLRGLLTSQEAANDRTAQSLSKIDDELTAAGGNHDPDTLGVTGPARWPPRAQDSSDIESASTYTHRAQHESQSGDITLLAEDLKTPPESWFTELTEAVNKGLIPLSLLRQQGISCRSILGPASGWEPCYNQQKHEVSLFRPRS
jgi:hypothetical protein